jgi:cell division septation protein DedD
MVAKLKSKGYPVVLKKTKRLTKVLVGPYSSRSVAAKSLLKIKRIQGDAFIYRKK